VLGPYVPLAAKLGKLAMALGGREVGRIAVEVYGELAEHDTRLLTVAALNGAFQGQVDQPVNYVNAPVVAADRGVEVVEEKRRSARDYTNLVAVSVDGARVAGTTIGKDARNFLVSALGFDLEIEVAPLMVFLTYDDVPGVIGRVGTLFGAAGVNIANLTVSRNNQGGKALMALSIDSPAPAELQEQLREGMDEAYLIG
jgi:D-3-phosphoglycerate dehydrogenase